MMDGSACQVIGTRTIKIIKRDGMVCFMEVVWYVPEAWYDLISKGCSMKKDVRSKCTKTSLQLANETG